MATDQVEPQYAEPRSGGCLKGCLIIFVIFLVIAIIVSVFVFMYWQPIGANIMNQMFSQQIDASNLPEQEKEESKAEVKRFTDAFAEGKISMSGFENGMEALVQSPIMPVIISSAMEAKYLQTSGLGEDEKNEGKVTINRFANAMVEHKVDQPTLDQTMQHVATKDSNGAYQLKPTVTDEELRAFLADAKAAADAAGIPAEPEPIDLSDEIKKIVDVALEVAGADDGADDDLPEIEPSLDEAPAEPAEPEVPEPAAP